MVTITIAGGDKSGALARISAFLVRKGYPVKGQQLVDSPSGAKVVKITIDAAQVDQARLTAEIEGLSPEYKVMSVESAQAADAPSLKDIAAKFPNIGPLVLAYAESFAADQREGELFEAGKKIGAFQYEKEWSLGSPLKMPTALRRTLVPALEALGKVDASDTEVRFPDSPFCTGRMACCGFLAGFMRGFLDAGPMTADVRVERASCRAKGGKLCSFRIGYDL